MPTNVFYALGLIRTLEYRLATSREFTRGGEGCIAT